MIINVRPDGNKNMRFDGPGKGPDLLKILKYVAFGFLILFLLYLRHKHGLAITF